MQLESLAVINIAKGKSLSSLSFESTAAELEPELRNSLRLESCQRRMWVTTLSQISQIQSKKLLQPGIQVYRDVDAYDFLLRVATGLESEVIGETDIFGQLKEAWKAFEATGSLLVCELHPWFQKLFEDTKEIRSRYLHDLGGASYGSLARKVLHQKAGRGKVGAGSHRESVLIVGAGQLAQSIAPWLLEYDLWLWNRTPAKLKRVAEELESRQCKNYRTIGAEGPESASGEELAWKSANHVIVCIPLDPENDAKRIEWWKEGKKKGYKKGNIIHLGGLREQCQRWQALGPSEFFALDDLFQLKDEQDAVRSRSIRLARIACEERARLRSLGGLSVPHGWEDLMGFASERELALSWMY